MFKVAVTGIALVLAAPAYALTFDFSFSGDGGGIPGTVTAELIGLQDNTRSFATDIIITSITSPYTFNHDMPWDVATDPRAWDHNATGAALTIANGQVLNWNIRVADITPGCNDNGNWCFFLNSYGGIDRPPPLSMMADLSGPYPFFGDGGRQSFAFASFGASFVSEDAVIGAASVPVVTPLPATLPLLAGGLGGLIWFLRMSRRATNLLANKRQRTGLCQ